MESQPLALAVLNIPELLDHTIDFLSESRVDLLSSALVSKSWVSRAQFHLFGKITLVPPKDMKLLRLLMKVLKTSPHLAHFIRHLSVSLNNHLLKGVAGMTLPRLTEVSVQCTDIQYRDYADLETDLLVQSLLRRPTIRRVILEGMFHSISTLHTYFDNCTRSMQRLELWDVYVNPIPTGDFAPNPSTPALLPSRIQLSNVTFPAQDCRALHAWMTSPRCPFGFSRLQRIHIGAERWRSSQSLLAPSLSSIEYLKLIEFSEDGDLDLSRLTKLKWLDVQLDQDWDLFEFLAMLYFVSAEDEKFFKNFDAAVTTLDVMHSLRRVEIEFAVCRPELDIPTLESYFPTLASKRQLFIRPPTVATTHEITYVYDSDEEESDLEEDLL
ncbi:hypothetical protein K438DRAFT_1963249 [Mycena galopus ATCC 62051]|nr:hypothetical protein K438DRAFT_1963249 [Mycena galopus ATCC 62051]